MGYFYRGRHRVPTNTAKGAITATAVTASVAATLGLNTGTAMAGPPGGWGPVIECESGGNHTAKNPSSTASGLFQFVNGTWAAYGGKEFAPTARQASPDEQYIVAERAYEAQGLRPWNASKHCWDDKIAAQSDKERSAAARKPEVQATSLPVTPETSAQPGPFVDGQYTVRHGDTLTSIAIAHGVAGGWEELFTHNKDVVEHKDWIYAGESLRIPGR